MDNNWHLPYALLDYRSDAVISCVTCALVTICITILYHEQRLVKFIKYFSPFTPLGCIGPTPSLQSMWKIGGLFVFLRCGARESFFNLECSARYFGSVHLCGVGVAILVQFSSDY